MDRWDTLYCIYRRYQLLGAASFGIAGVPAVCRSGLVISIAEPDTLFVIKKMAKRLQVPIEKAAVSEGVLALDEEEADLPAAAARG